MILVSSYPKSGATWFRFLSYSAVMGTIKKSMDVADFYPELFPDKSQDSVIQNKLEKGELFLAKTHLPYKTPLPYEKSITHVIYIVRNPFDALVSRLNHYRLDGDDSFDPKKILNSLIDEANNTGEELGGNRTEGGWNHHVNSWMSNQNFKMLVIKYEDLLQQCNHEMYKFEKFAPFKIKEENRKEACKRSSFANMKELEKFEISNSIPGLFYNKKRAKNFKEKGVQFVNKGKFGNYKDYFDQETFERAKDVFGDTMKLVGYNLDDFTLGA